MKYITISCLECGLNFQIKPSRINTARYCSKKCYGVAKKNDIIEGSKFNRLTIIKEVEPEIQYSKGKETKLRKVQCLCDCGNITTPRLVMVRNGEAKSCGCLTREQAKVNTDQTTHGLSKHPLYIVWSGMIQRCHNENNGAYKDYGARGIIVCDKWHNFKNFYDDMNLGYSMGLEIERVNNNGIYEKSNCKWETPKIQSGNRRNSVIVIFNGEKMCLSFACEKAGVKLYRIARLMKLYNYSFEEAIKVPIGTIHKKI